MTNDFSGYWPMDEASGNVADKSGNGYTGTPNGTTVVAGKLSGNARSFNGTSDYISMAGGGGLNNIQTGSLAMWVKWTGTQDVDVSANTWGAVSSRQKNATFSETILALSTSNPATAKVVWKPYLYNIAAITGATTVGSGVWRHIVVTYSSGAQTLYVDGYSDGTGTQTGTISNDATIALSIGAWIGDGAGFSTSVIDDVRTYQRVLTAAQAYELFLFTGLGTKFNNSGVRPRPFAPGIAR
jgi:hypothetical protein